MNKAVRRGRVRLAPYVDATLAKRLVEFCAAAGATESAVVGAAVQQYLDGTSDTALLLRRLDRLGRAAARHQRDLELLSEAFGVFVRLWFAHTPNIPEDGKKSARASAEARYTQFVQHVSEQFSAGRRLLEDLPGEPLGDEGELSAAGARPFQGTGISHHERDSP
jgi:hypothetical protein